MFPIVFSFDYLNISNIKLNSGFYKPRQRNVISKTASFNRAKRGPYRSHPKTSQYVREVFLTWQVCIGEVKHLNKTSHRTSVCTLDIRRILPKVWYFGYKPSLPNTLREDRCLDPLSHLLKLGLERGSFHSHLQREGMTGGWLGRRD